MIYTLRLNQHPDPTDLKALLSRVWNESTEFIGARAASGNYIIQYELTPLEGRSFNVELCVFVNLQEALAKGFYNDFELARAVSEDVLQEVVVSTHTDDPYLWVLLRKGAAYLFESADMGDDSIVVPEDRLTPLKIDAIQQHHVGRESIEEALRHNQNDVPVFLKADSWWRAEAKTS